MQNLTCFFHLMSFLIISQERKRIGEKGNFNWKKNEKQKQKQFHSKYDNELIKMRKSTLHNWELSYQMKYQNNEVKNAKRSHKQIALTANHSF